ncbi:LysR substrate-binding domain-containing protein [Bradyrhizobium sp. AZCC 2230]|uniref:LysR substrate-binding domain-containing protein n=1 Tax=Bradyrhizobium sp. AZCC 2230 TaxID=3117021 RepID=UPI002FF294D5
MQAFEAASRHESFSRAADELSLTQGAISRQIAELEALLGVQLFERVRNGVMLTARGVEYARRVRLNLDQLRRDTRDIMKPGPEVRLEIAVGLSFSVQWLIPRLPQFHASYPNIVLHLSARDQPSFFENFDFDASIHFDVRPVPGLCCDMLLDNDVLVPVSSAAFAAKCGGGNSNALRLGPFIHTRDLPDAWSNWFDTVLGEEEPDLPAHSYDMYVMAIRAAEAGIGIALLPRILIEPELESGRLVQLHSCTVQNPYRIYLAYPEQKRGQPRLEAFRSWLLGSVRAYALQTPKQVG